MVMLIGVWCTLQFLVDPPPSQSKRRPSGGLFEWPTVGWCERLLFAVTPPSAIALIMMAVIRMQGVDNSPFYLCALTTISMAVYT